jgi:hypothetical protein
MFRQFCPRKSELPGEAAENFPRRAAAWRLGGENG